MPAVTPSRETLLGRLESACRKRRLSRWQRLLRSPGSAAKSFFGLRLLNTVLRQKVILPVRARTFFGDRMRLLIPSSLEDIWLYHACVYSDAEFRFAQFLIRELQEGAVFFDVGANIGYYTLLASRLVGDSGAVRAFEPLPYVLRMLRENVAGRPNIAIVDKALSSERGRAALHVAPRHLLGSSSLNPESLAGLKDGGAAAQVEVETITLDDYIAESGTRPTFMKIDVEGAEDKVLKGAGRLLSGPGPLTVIMEVWFNPMRECYRSAMQTLRDHGFSPLILQEDGRAVPSSFEELPRHFSALEKFYPTVDDHGPDNLAFRKFP